MQDGKGAKEYEPNEDTVALFTRYCGVSSKQEIAERGRRIREKALISYPYRCIQEYWFMETRVAHHPCYRELLVREDKAQRTVLDIGCCMGTDARVMLSDGFVTEDNFTGVDICNDFIQLGYELFEDKDRLKCKFMVADVVEGDVDVPFAGKTYDMIYCGSVFHLLDEAKCKKLARNAAKLLATSTEGEQKKVFFGKTVGSKLDSPLWKAEQLRYLHTKETLRALLEEVGLHDVTITSMSHPEIPSDTAMLTFIGCK